MLDISVIIPIYNAGNLLEKAVLQVIEALEGQNLKYEIILCDDKSGDNSASIMRNLTAVLSCVRCIYNKTNRGLGAVLRELASEARGQIVIYSDIDLPFGSKVFKILIDALNDCDMAVASRYISGRSQVPVNRFIFSSLYSYLCRLMFGIKLRDIGSGAVAWRRDRGTVLNTTQDGFGIHVEMYTIAMKKVLKIKEIPVPAELYLPGTFSVLRHGFAVVCETLKVWLRLRISRLDIKQI